MGKICTEMVSMALMFELKGAELFDFSMVHYLNCSLFSWISMLLLSVYHFSVNMLIGGGGFKVVHSL